MNRINFKLIYVLLLLLSIELFTYCESKKTEENTVSEDFIKTEIKKDSVFVQDADSNKVATTKEKDLFEKLANEKEVAVNELTFSHVLDSLQIDNQEKRKYYFIQITKTIQHAQGAYSEALGYHTLQFLNQHLSDFIQLKLNNKITDIDFNNWVLLAGNELELQKDISKPSIVKDFLKYLNKEKINYSKAELKEIEKIERLIKKRFE